ncbi:MAG TPA: Uma2 family endonuclease [Planctomycetes bacterium]|nr:Uma2 family endonuclease [Planctomycetota bacterium]
MQNATSRRYATGMPDDASTLLSPRPISRREFNRMVEAGVFEGGERIELLRGVVVRMSPQSSRHAYAVRRLDRLFQLALQGQVEVCAQLPFAALGDTQPEPDLTLVPPGDYLDDHPPEAYLVVEVANSSLERDRVIKRAIYAENGVPEYWVVNLIAGTVEVHTDPSDGDYATKQTFPRGSSIVLHAFPGVSVPVDDFVPPAAAE